MAVAVDIGWRKLDDRSIRVAYWHDETGKHDQLLLPAGIMDQFRKLDDLRSIMDAHFNVIRDRLSDALKQLTGTIPAEVQAAFVNIGQWKSAGRLVRAMKVWEQNRFAGDSQMWSEIEYWYYGAKQKPDQLWNGHKHLWLWFCNLSDQLQRNRREFYRVFAAGLAQQYGRVFLEGFDLRQIAETPAVENDTEYDKQARYQRTKAATSVLRQAIIGACASRGVKYEEVNAGWSTHICVNCGHLIVFDAAKELVCTCDDCGTVYDQDHLGAMNVLARGV